MPIILPTSKTEPVSDLERQVILLYAPPKFGKSTFCSQFDNPLFLATEAGLNNLSTYQVPITSWEDFMGACLEVSKGGHNFKTVVIDTVDLLVKFCEDYVCKQNKVETVGDLPFGKGYALTRNELLRALTKLSHLPYGLVMTSHERVDEVKTRTMTINKSTPSIPNSYRPTILGLSDIILFGQTIQSKNEKGEVKEERILHTKATESFDGGDRSGKLPASMPFSYQEFKKSWDNKNKEMKEGK